jgi:type II secretory pathway pseudopilin PulG
MSPRLYSGCCRRAAFTLTELLVVVLIVVFLLAMLVPALNVSRGPSQRNACTNNIRQLAIAVNNYMDSYKKLPMICREGQPIATELVAGANKLCAVPGTDDPIAQDDGTDYSFFVKLLPYIEEGNLYNEISANSTKFSATPYEKSIRIKLNNKSVHPSQVEISTIRCPGFAGDTYSTAPEFSRFVEKNSDGNAATRAAVSNYVATMASDLKHVTDGDADGMIVPGKQVLPKHIKDGLSRTIVLCETKESAYSSWYDASCSWVIATPPSVAIDSSTDRNTLVAVGYGPTTDDSDRLYLPKRFWKNQTDRAWGPSSDHGGGVVMHAYGDAGTRPLKMDVDPYVYRALITRAGEEKGIPACHLQTQ